MNANWRLTTAMIMPSAQICSLDSTAPVVKAMKEMELPAQVTYIINAGIIEAYMAKNFPLYT